MTDVTPIPLDQLAVDSGINPQPDAPCPHCGSVYDVSRGSEIGVALLDGARLCSDCINDSVPGLAGVLDLVTDLQFAIEESERPALLAVACRGLFKAATQSLLYDLEWHAELTDRHLQSVPDVPA